MNTDHPHLDLAKYRIVRWNDLVKKDGTHTIEFRLPDGTLSSFRASFTVQIYVALVRAAERHANREAVGKCPRRKMRKRCIAR